MTKLRIAVFMFQNRLAGLQERVHRSMLDDFSFIALLVLIAWQEPVDLIRITKKGTDVS